MYKFGEAMVPTKFYVGSGTGEDDQFPLVAFDRSLREAGVADANLSRVTSILPPGCEQVEDKEQVGAEVQPPFAFGAVSYAAFPKGRILHAAYGAESVLNTTQSWLVLVAGVGVAVPKDEMYATRNGVIVEHHEAFDRAERFASSAGSDEIQKVTEDYMTNYLGNMLRQCMADRGLDLDQWKPLYKVAVKIVRPKRAGAVVALCALW